MANESRISGRIVRILGARTAAVRKLAGLEESPAVAGSDLDPLEQTAAVAIRNLRKRNLRRKIAEFDQSLANFQRFGSEAPPTGNAVSVNIDVPKGTFTIESHAPEG